MTDKGHDYRVYSIVLRPLRGEPRTARVVTNRGAAKAVYLAASTARNAWKKDALDVLVEDLGEPTIGSDGFPDLSGAIIDRNEW